MNIKCEINTINKTYSVDITNNSTYDFHNNLLLNFNFSNNFIKISLKNTSSETITINKLRLHIHSLDLQGYTKAILNPEFSNKKMNVVSTENISKKEISFLYSLFFAKENYANYIVGFLSSHKSQNYIEILNKKDFLEIFAVYDMICFNLDPEETIELDTIYIKKDRSINKLLNDYGQALGTLCNNNLVNTKNFEFTSESIQANLLYETSSSADVLVKNRKPLTVTLSNKKYYLLDITKSQVKDKIIAKIKGLNVIPNKSIFINNLKPYIETVVEHKLFNVYYELSELFNMLNTSIDSSKIMFDDCPGGIAAGNMTIIKENFRYDENTILKRYSFFNKKESYSNNYNFILKTILQKNIFENNSIINVNNKKIKQAMEVISSNIRHISQSSSLYNIFSDMDNSKPICFSFRDDGTFAILRYGFESFYLGIFNLTLKECSFYWDFSVDSDLTDINCTGFDFFTNEDYLIYGSTIEIKHLKGMDCCLIVGKVNPSIKEAEVE